MGKRDLASVWAYIPLSRHFFKGFTMDVRSTCATGSGSVVLRISSVGALSRHFLFEIPKDSRSCPTIFRILWFSGGVDGCGGGMEGCGDDGCAGWIVGCGHGGCGAAGGMVVVVVWWW